MINKRVLTCVLVCVAVLLLVASVGTAAAQDPIEQLGESLFFDEDLSNPVGQSCATCHDPEVGFVGPHSAINEAGAVYEGAFSGRFGNRKPPTAAYGGASPQLYYDEGEGVWVGGMFWDGRATGWTLLDPLAEQALGPFLNPLEQNNASEQAVIDQVLGSSYGDLFRQVCTDSSIYYECIGRSIAAYERSAKVNPFSSKYDADELTEEEAWGLALFEGKAMCSACHISEGPNGEPPLFTDFTYDNLGVPKNPQNPFYIETDWNPDGTRWVDNGLGGFLQAAGYRANVYKAELGKQKVPTLRNVAKGSCEAEPDNENCIVKAYGHNGYFKSLEAIVHFYNTRDTLPTCPPEPPFVPVAPASPLVPGLDCWPKSEVPKNVNRTELGNLGLTPDEEAAVVAFMKALSDGYQP